nr:zinc finger protein 84-like [Penaeus vannamei]
MISTATMDDSSSIIKMHSTISFCVLKEEKVEDISEEDFQAIKEEINDVDENDVNIRKVDESPVCEEDRSPREKVIEKNSNKTLNMNIEDDNAIYIMAGGEVDTNNENAVSDKFKSLGEKTDTFMCEDGDPLASSVPCVAEARRKKKSSLTAKRTRKKGDKKVNRNRKEAKEKHFTCEICPKKFSFKSEILLHMRVHTKEKPFSCEICSKSFTKKSTLLQHARIHTHEKPFSCKLCNKKFSQKGNLDTHTRFHTTEKPYSCRICSMAFSVKSQLVCHIRVHTKEKPFICDVCNKFFTWKSDLDRHLRVHTKVKPFTCGICDKSFAWKSDLKRHLRVHTKETPYIGGSGMITGYSQDHMVFVIPMYWTADRHEYRVNIVLGQLLTELSLSGNPPLLGICNHCHIYHKLPKLGALTQTLTSSLCFSIRSSTSGLESFYEISQTIFLLNPWTNTYFKMGLLDIKISVSGTLRSYIRPRRFPYLFRGPIDYSLMFMRAKKTKGDEQANLTKDIYKETLVFIKAEDEANMISEEIKCPGEEGVKNDSDFCVYKDEDPLLLPTQDVAGDCRKLCPLDGDQTIHKEDKEVTHKNKNKEAKVKHFSCEVCGRKYRCKSRLVAHIRVHTKEKPFSCKVCNKSFLRKDYVVEHMKVHSSEKPYACEICSKDFSRKGHLVKHIKGVHMKEKPYLCEICSKVFSVKSDLSVHMRVHTNEKELSGEKSKEVFI